MSPISLSTSVAGIEALFSPRGQRPDRRSRSRPAAARCGGPRSSAAKMPDQHAGGAEHDALPFGLRQRPGKIARQHPAAPRADFAQQFGDAPDQPALGAQHLLVDIGDLPLADRHMRDDGIGIVVDRRAQVRIRRSSSARMLCAACSAADGIVRQQRRGDPALGLQQGSTQAARSRAAAIAASNCSRSGGKRGDQLGAAIDQRGDPLDAVAIGRQPLGDAVDHVLLLGRKLEPGLLQDLAERRGGLADLDRTGRRDR